MVGPWTPATPKEIAEERRRVRDEEPRRWWWEPRYRVAELERGGMGRAAAISKVRAEHEGEHGGDR